MPLQASRQSARFLSAELTTISAAAAPGRIQAAFPERSGRVPHNQLHHEVPALLHNVVFRSTNHKFTSKDTWQVKDPKSTSQSCVGLQKADSPGLNVINSFTPSERKAPCRILHISGVLQ